MMKKLILAGLMLIALAGASFAEGQKFSLTVGDNESLQIFGAAGEKVAELTPGTIGKSITIGGSEFTASYGRDVNDRLSAILSPNLSKPAPMSFSVAGKSVETDGNAIVTLTYASDLKQVTIDGGYIGSVKVDGQKLQGQAVASERPAAKKSAEVAQVEKSEAKMESAAVTSAPEVASSPAATESRGETPTASASTETASPSDKNMEEVAWAREVSAANMEAAKADPVGQVRLVEVVGEVYVTDPTKGVNNVKAENGMLVTSGAKVVTKEHSTAAVIIGGLHTARLVPETDSQIEQKMAGTTRDTEVKLQKGSVFVQVNKRPGEAQDFKVRTPVGVAAAKGSASKVGFNGSRMVVAAAHSRWKATDGSGKSFTVGPMFAKGPTGGFIKALGLGSIPPSDGKQLMSEVMQSLKQALEVNQMTQQFADKNNGGQNNGPKIVVHQTVSLLAGNAMTMIDGAKNPNTGLEGTLRQLADNALQVVDGFVSTDPEQKDDPNQPVVTTVGNSILQKLGDQPVNNAINPNITVKTNNGETSPGGNSSLP